MSPRFEIVPIESVPKEDASELQPVLMVVDDERIVADTLSTIFRMAGYRVRTAYTAAAALKMLNDANPDLLISDVAMPEMNGVQLAVELLKHTPKCKVLLFSGHAGSADLIGGVEAGHNFRLLAKPLHPTDLLREVAETLGIPQQPTAERAPASNVIPIRKYA